MADWKPIVGMSYSIQEFDTFCHGLQWESWRPCFIVLHNTVIPALRDMPEGFTAHGMDGLIHYYRDEKKLSAGPHLLIDDHRVWMFTPLTMPGVHSPSWNKLSIGVEMLGNYDQEAFNAGRGLKVRNNSVSAVATLCEVLGLDPYTMQLHKEDPLVSHNCPGKNVSKSEFVEEVQTLIAARNNGVYVT